MDKVIHTLKKNNTKHKGRDPNPRRIMRINEVTGRVPGHLTARGQSDPACLSPGGGGGDKKTQTQILSDSFNTN